MIKNILLAIILFVKINGFSQNDLKLPELGIPSPQAFQFTKFGDTPVNESSGKISPTIPLYTLKSGALELPLTLSYSGNGVKISEVSPWTGINWTLSSGGVISRIVKDLPDETDKPRYLLSEQELDTYVNPVPNSSGGIFYYFDSEIIKMIKRKDDYDSQADIFNFSFPGYSGTFYLKFNAVTNTFAPILSKYDRELKISIEGDFTMTGDFYFTIVTPEGIKYTFGGLYDQINYANEETQLVDRSQSEPYFGVRAKTSFYLTKIENHLGDVINLDYLNKESYEVFSPQNQKLEKLLGSGEDGGCSNGNPNFPVGLNNLNFTGLNRNIVYNGKFLSGITDNHSNSILFNSIENTTLLNEYSRILTGISIVNLFNINFEYFPSLSSGLNTLDRFFLTNVIINNHTQTNTNQSQRYTFEYNEPEILPNIQSFSQDYLGYYNNKINPSLLPRNSTSFLGANFGDTLLNQLNFTDYDALLADREPDFEYATKGVLTKIIYPTGGYSFFEYEPVEKKVINGSTNLLIYNNMSNANPAWVINSKLTDDSFISNNGLDENFQVGQSVYVSQTVIANLEINTLNGSDLDNRDYVYIKTTRLNSNHPPNIQKYNFPTEVHNYGNTQTYFTQTFSIDLIGGENYTFELGFGDNIGGPINGSNINEFFTPTGLTASLSFNYIKGLNPIDGLGIRIKRVSDFTDEGTEPVTIKRFYYNKITEINDLTDSKNIKFKQFYHNFNLRLLSCNNDDGFEDPKLYIYGTLNSNSFDILQSKFESQAFYNAVSISYGGDNFENGGQEKIFSIDTTNKEQKMFIADPILRLDPATVGYALFNEYKKYDTSGMGNGRNTDGTVIKESIWTKKNGGLFKVKTTNYEYQITNRDTINNIMAMQTFDASSLPLLSPPNNYTGCYMGLFKYVSFKNQLISKTTKDYIDPVPISVYIPNIHHGNWNPNNNPMPTEEEIEAPYKKIINTQTFEYTEGLCGLPSQISTYNSSNTLNLTKNYYPTDFFINQMYGLTQSEINSYIVLKSESRLSTPIQVENYDGTTKLTTSRTTFNSFANNRVLPDKIKFSKGNSNFENRIVYHSYDNNGNPREISLQDGTRVLYMWTSTKRPLIKMVNVTYQEYLTGAAGFIITADEITPSQEIQFRNNFPKAQITTYSYTAFSDLISKITDPSGKATFYEYDEFYRLKFIKDNEGKILSENEYHYRNQN